MIIEEIKKALTAKKTRTVKVISADIFGKEIVPVVDTKYYYCMDTSWDYLRIKLKEKYDRVDEVDEDNLIVFVRKEIEDK